LGDARNDTVAVLQAVPYGQFRVVVARCVDQDFEAGIKEKRIDGLNIFRVFRRFTNYAGYGANIVFQVLARVVDVPAEFVGDFLYHLVLGKVQTWIVIGDIPIDELAVRGNLAVAVRGNRDA
jgi:hypothetical protein